jgi:hypothetical protein
MKKIDRKFLVALYILCTTFLLVDRYYWAQISQWREDQATNIWLGYSLGLSHIPVGLISASGIPNPNGMVILGHILSRLPNLLSISLFLGLAQIILIILVAWSSSRQICGYFLLMLVPSVSSVVLRSTSIEFWNQYLLTHINLLFFLCVYRYLEKPSLWIVPPFVALICIAPSLYLAGIVNAIVMTLLAIGIILYKRPAVENIFPVLSISLIIVLISISFTWLPYFKNINIEQILNFNKEKQSVVAMLKIAWESFFEFPVFTTFQWAERANFLNSFKHSDVRILSSETELMLKLVGGAYLAQSIFGFTVVICTGILGVKNKVKLELDQSATRIVVLSGLFIILSYIFSAWLGGEPWIEYIRSDQIVQFLPMSLFVIFLLPFVFVVNGRTRKMFSLLTCISLIVFGISNFSCGFMIIRDHLKYHGDVLTEADVPLTDKMQVIKFIAEDWRKHSNLDIVPVDYHLGGGKWDWVPEAGLSLTPWYQASFTEGRSFDYSLKRQYGLINWQEGTQLRTFGTGRYLVTYAFEDAPAIPAGNITHYLFGRLRVSVVE